MSTFILRNDLSEAILFIFNNRHKYKYSACPQANSDTLDETCQKQRHFCGITSCSNHSLFVSLNSLPKDMLSMHLHCFTDGLNEARLLMNYVLCCDTSLLSKT